MEKIGSTEIKFGSASEMEDAIRTLAGEGMNGLAVNAALTQEFVCEETRDKAFAVLEDETGTTERDLYEIHVAGYPVRYLVIDGDLAAAGWKAIEMFRGGRVEIVKALGKVSVCNGMGARR